MPALTQAVGPTAVVTEIPGRFSPVFVTDKRNPSAIVTSTATNSLNALLPRADTVSSSFAVPTTPVIELGADLNVGEFDDIPVSKASLSVYDTGHTPISLITGKAAPASSTTTWTFSDFATAQADVVRQFADPNGNIFASMYMGDLAVEGFSASLKTKSAAMEQYDLTGFNMLMFRGFIIAKAYVVQSADVTANSFSLASVFGANEGPVALPVHTGNNPATYWEQTGRINFLKVERYRASTGWVRFPETTGTVATGQCKFATGTLSFHAGDLVAGDIFIVTYCSYGSSVANYNTIPQQSLDTSDPTAIPTRLTPITISGLNISRGQALDLKMTLKREQAGGIGDADGFWGPPDAPQLSVSLEVKQTDFGLLSLMQTGTTMEGTDDGGTVAGDFFDPGYMTRLQLSTSVPIVATLNDPRSANVVVKTYTSSTPVFKNVDLSSNTKSANTIKFTGDDRVGNLQISVTLP